MDAFFAKIQKSNDSQLKEEVKQTKLLAELLKAQQLETKNAERERRRAAQKEKTGSADSDIKKLMKAGGGTGAAAKKGNPLSGLGLMAGAGLIAGATAYFTSPEFRNKINEAVRNICNKRQFYV